MKQRIHLIYKCGYIYKKTSKGTEVLIDRALLEDLFFFQSLFESVGFEVTIEHVVS